MFNYHPFSFHLISFYFNFPLSFVICLSTIIYINLQINSFIICIFYIFFANPTVLHKVIFSFKWKSRIWSCKLSQWVGFERSCSFYTFRWRNTWTKICCLAWKVSGNKSKFFCSKLHKSHRNYIILKIYTFFYINENFVNLF